MKKLSFLTFALAAGLYTFAQPLRYYEPVFTQISVTQGVTYGTNVNFLICGDLANPANQAQVQQDLINLNTLIMSGQPIPSNYYIPFSDDTSSIVKVGNLEMDIYEPDQTVDAEGARPVIILIHSGSFLPQLANGFPVGTRTDSSIVNLARRFARRGYVTVSISYRHGWNPLAPTVEERRAQLINAVYRAIHDVKQCVRFLKADAATSNTYAINPNQIVLYGEGSGGYMALTYATLDKPSEINLPKFTWPSGHPLAGQPFIDSNTVGNLDGLGGSLNLYQDNGFSSDVAMVASASGALGDTSWLEAGDVPMVSFHTVRDGSAPFENGIVMVPPPISQDVVEVQGPNLFIKKANDLGNNDAFRDVLFPNDVFTERARSIYGNTYSYFLPAPFNNITVQDSLEGCFPVVVPLAATQFEQVSSPWQWWDPTTLTAVVTAVNAQLGTNYDANTIHQAGLASNPNMGPVQGNAYLDTIQGYLLPRIMLSLNLPGTERFTIGVDEAVQAAQAINIYPNPAMDHLTIDVADAPKDVVAVEMINSMGQIVRSANITGTELQWELNDLAGGIYFLNFEFEDHTRGARQLIIQ